MRTLGLLFATTLAMALPLHAYAAGCQYDMQCKGERLCQKGQCVSPDDDDQSADQPAKPPASRFAPAPTPAASQVPASSRMAKSAPPATPVPGEPRFCCTVAGRLKPYNNAAFDSDTIVGDACQGMTNSGKPVPGTACQ
ncbi:hypothetical protein [Cupriavidus sp. UME77]|uniref:hypothetical protein n=1 Tax=Cupriavidus sp. UME77 TaxID=1862321 RepID=UPI00160242EC|nr:hypothetical protein [Cupriavidus sp. UME77]MBB1633341.1 hypothetical protein [Cupriavidus sp. UME77]